MTQSKKDKFDIESIVIDNMSSGSTIDAITLDNSITIDLGNYGAAQSVYSITSDTITIGDGTVSINTNSADWLNNSGIIQTGDINLDWNNIVFEKTIFQDCMPNLADVEQMCKEYPALEKAFENFKTIYKMVEQDYKGKKKAGELDE